MSSHYLDLFFLGLIIVAVLAPAVSTVERKTFEKLVAVISKYFHKK